MSVYFVQSKLTGNVKIGYTRKPVALRMKSLQTGNDGELELVLEIPEGTRRTEAHLHEKFAYYHVRGEWFQFSQELQFWTKRYAKRRDSAPFDLIVNTLVGRLGSTRAWECQCSERRLPTCCAFCGERRKRQARDRRRADGMAELRAKLRLIESRVAVEFRGRRVPNEILEGVLKLRKEVGEWVNELGTPSVQPRASA